MKRRTFLKLCAASVAVAAIPPAIALSPHFTPTNVRFYGESSCYNLKYSLAIELHIDGVLYRHAIEFSQPLEELTEADIDRGKTILLDWANDRYLKAA